MSFPISQESELPYRFPVTVRCGQSKCKVEFSTYYYTDNPEVDRPGMFDPPPEEEIGASPQAQLTTPTEPVKEKNVNNL